MLGLKLNRVRKSGPCWGPLSDFHYFLFGQDYHVWDSFHERFMSSKLNAVLWFYSYLTEINQSCNNFKHVMTVHFIVTCAKLWPHLIIIFKSKIISISELWAHKTFVNRSLGSVGLTLGRQGKPSKAPTTTLLPPNQDSPLTWHDDVMAWKRFPHCLSFVMWIQSSIVVFLYQLHRAWWCLCRLYKQAIEQMIEHLIRYPRCWWHTMFRSLFRI